MTVLHVVVTIVICVGQLIQIMHRGLKNFTESTCLYQNTYCQKKLQKFM